MSASPPEEIAAYFDAIVSGDPLEPNYNVAPTVDVYVVYSDGTERRVDPFHWGLIPAWAKDTRIGSRLINARSETAATNNSFKHSLERRRCIVPADGFYEWKAVEGQRTKQPYFVHRRDGEPLPMAGLWAEWTGQVAGERVTVRSTTVLTTDANETMAPIHERMPVLLPRRSWDDWLDPGNRDVASLQRLLVPAPRSLLVMHPVSTEVNNSRHEGRHLIDEIDASEVVGAAQGEQGTLL